MIMNKPELLAPAGDFEKLKIAIAYGADAVYIGGTSFGLRAKAKNFDMEEMEKAIIYAHNKNVKVYVTANIFAHNDDFKDMASYFLELDKINVDAIIVADPGVFSVVRETLPNMEIHISTQANNTNYMSAKFWKSLGASRIVVARELSINEITDITNKTKEANTQIEIEAFVHGAMCISYSGRCLLSNYMTNRDANKGECSHACRWKYSLVEEKRPGEYMPVVEDEKGTYIYNSKDLCMVLNIGDLVNAGVTSFKIEGRMKTPHYVGTVIKAYRNAIDDYFESEELYNSRKDYYLSELKKSSHRDYTAGFYYGKPNQDDQLYTSNTYIRDYDFVGIVIDYDKETQIATVEQRNKFSVGDELEIFRTVGHSFIQVINEIKTDEGEIVETAPHPQQILKIKFDEPVNEFDMLRKASK